MIVSKEYPNLFIVDHPLVLHKLTQMRESSCPPSRFRSLLKDISTLMTYAVTENLPVTTKKIKTPLVEMDAPVLACNEPVIVPILRAGLGLVDGPLSVMQDAIVGHVGVYRDEQTHLPHEYLVKMPQQMPLDRHFLIVDPMLATGGSAIHVTDVLVGRGVDRNKIAMMVLVAAPEGVKAYHARYPEVPIYTASLDSHLNDYAYIVPGLGDAGDRIFGTL
ncbi:MAG TPA: uracil phosphoribosyltransferase [Alphaproteobacteria bacterium]|nr:uracil phosphoribosyltransferase [Alphaproteobacteria bacterium]HNS44852.1 uracil phosphoribosyltransferase [Alphaproteobacteria bacterium]